MIAVAGLPTPWGEFGVHWSRTGVCRLSFPGQEPVRGRGVEPPPFVRRLARDLERYLSGERVALDVRLDLSAVSPFDRAVYEAARAVPRGQLATYGSLARRLGRPGAARAVGAALGRNPVPLVVPCHRIVGADGALVGFSAPGGLELKTRLLELEGAFPAPGPPSVELEIPVPAGFHFDHTVRSHGWYVLPPFGYHRELGTLHTAFEIAPGRAVSLRIRPRRRALVALVHGAKRVPIEPVVRAVRRMFQLDRDLAGFYEVLARDGSRPWIEAGGMGRFLAAPTVFEDLVKTLLSTNCSWALLESSVDRLVRLLGTPAPGGLRAFPGPARIAESSERFLRDEIRVGYRAPFLRALARRVASGELDPETWPDRPPDEVRGLVKDLAGFGEYASANLFRLLGCFDRLGVDSWIRARSGATEAALERRYRKFGDHRGLVLWLDLTRSWHLDAATKPWA